MKSLIGTFVVILLVSEVSGAQLQSTELTDYSFSNSVSMEIDDWRGNPKGIKLKLRAENKGEPAGLPIYLSLHIRCKGTNQYKPIDLGAQLKSAGGNTLRRYRHLIGAPTRDFPGGQLHVCAFESLNFDQDLLKLKVLDARGGEGCEQSQTVDFILPLREYCPR